MILLPVLSILLLQSCSNSPKVKEKEKAEQVKEKEQLFRNMLRHPKIKAVRSAGLWMAIEFESFDINKMVIDSALQEGVLTDWFLFAPHCMRIVPPLTIDKNQIEMACRIIMESIERL